MRKIDGRKAEITSPGRRFSTYWEFARKHGYPDAVAESDWHDKRQTPQEGDIVTLLTSGPHLTMYEGDTLWIVEDANGDRHIFNEKGLRILENVNITVLKDETLGGIEREYTEVKRKAHIGERIKNTSQSFDLPVGYVTEVTGIAAAGMVEYVDAAGDERMRAEFTYVVLEPTDIVRVNGERLRMVERKAAKGERVIVVNDRDGTGGSDGYYFRTGNTGIAISVDFVNFSGNEYVLQDGRWGIAPRAYCVLEPVSSVQSTSAQPPTEPSIAELIAITDGLTDAVAKLTRKIVELETHVKVTEGDVVLIESGVADEIDALKQAAKPVKELTRDDVIERAKADVAKLQTENHEDIPALTGFRVKYYAGWDEVKFVVNHDKRTVVALLSLEGTVWARGIAKAAPGDVFNSHIGRAIALRRALGLEVPAEYTNAPQPSEPRVGDIVADGIRTGRVHAVRPKTKTAGAYEHGLVLSDAEAGLTFMITLSGKPYEYWTRIKSVTVLDDSRETDEEVAV
ncbi:hypothetical protein EV294_11291 [Paenibacillus sp. BK033]|uniref:hypothetical protein n=1 Tax=Paenibacillus sp. BK033 TaxID=2512133 RepID=UPI0010537FA7|nr:hypothetical protein [Paenibacillus sp. BK033]TCM89626.1 hypothetical protein EV294_11291 [Paenibacillus sp. BK033]